MDVPADTLRSASLPRIGVGGPVARLRLVRADEAGEPSRAPGSDPFVEVSGPDSTHRAYLAELRLGTAPDPRPLVVVLELNELPQADSAVALWTSSHREAAWRSGFVSMRAAAGPGLAAIDASSGDELPHHPPVAYCPISDTYAIPVCPACLGPLATCRDEELLRRSGLPAFESGVDRFLSCASCLGDPTRPNVFYTHRRRFTGTPAAGVEVRHRHDLYADLAPRISSADPALATHGCFVCKQNATAPAAGVVRAALPTHDAQAIYPLAYYDSVYFVREALPLAFEEAAALLGGAALDELLAQRATRQGFARSAEGRRVAERLGAATPQFFFHGDRTGLFLLETLYLKLSAFLDLLDAIIRIAEKARRPHFALAPSRVRGVVRGRDTHLPARWGLSLGITDLVTTAPLARLGEHELPPDPPLWLVPEARPAAFLPTEMARAQTSVAQMRLTPRSLELIGIAEAARARLTGSLRSELYVASEHGRHDRVLVSIAGPASGQRIRFAGVRTAGTTGGFDFEGTSGHLRPEDAAAFRDAKVLDGASAEVTLLRHYGAPSDLLALGQLYFRLLFWNDRQDAARLGRDLLQRIALRLTGRERGAQGPRVLFEWDELAAVLGEEAVDLPPSALLARAEDRETETRLPLSLWSEVWTVGLRLATFVPGFSFAGAIDDEDPARPAEALRRARSEVLALAEQVRASLIGSSGRNRFVLEAAQDFLDDLVEATQTFEAEQPGSAEATMVFGTRRTP